MNPPCVLEADDWCPRHKMRHHGHTRALALGSDHQSAQVRHAWDQLRSGVLHVLPDSPKPPAPKVCIHKGAELRDAGGKIRTADVESLAPT